jgi:hypothetical protein
LLLLLLRERDATKESTARTVLPEKKHPDVKVATVVDEHYSTPCRVSRDERSKHISFFLSFFVGRESHKREREKEQLKN